MEYKDYYETLGVSRNASQDDIQKAYRKLARKHHPDVNRSPGAEDRFKEITEAYEVLKDEKKRSTYDRFGSAWKSSGGPPPGFEGFGGFDGVRVNFSGGQGASGFSSFFDMLFGNRGGGRGPFGGGDPFGDDPFARFNTGFGGESRRRARDQHVKLALTLEEAAEGGHREITVSDMVGNTRTYGVNLPSGMKPGQKVRLPSRDGTTGDLYLEVQLKPHDRFRLEGQDLHAEIRVTPWEAALGTDATVRTLDGSVKVRIPPGSSSGRKIRLRGRGYPSRDGTGDLYAEIRVMVPEELTERERELFEELARTSGFKTR